MSTLATSSPEETPIRGSRRRYDPAWDDWRRPRRWPGILLSCVVVLGFIGVVVWHYRPHASKPPSSASAGLQYAGPPAGAYVPLASGHGAQVRTFRGTHNAQGLRFGTSGNLLILEARCACSYNFVVTILNSVGSPVAFPVNSTGGFDATLNVTLPRGVYTLNVVAPAPASWLVSLIQPLSTAPVIPTPAAQWCKKGKPPPCPFSFFTIHSSILGPFSARDRYLYFKFYSTTNGQARVYVLNPQGVHLDQAFFLRVPKQEGTTLPNPPSPYYVEVDASGYWQLNVQPNASG